MIRQLETDGKLETMRFNGSENPLLSFGGTKLWNGMDRAWVKDAEGARYILDAMPDSAPNSARRLKEKWCAKMR